jgi:ferredoxin
MSQLEQSQLNRPIASPMARPFNAMLSALAQRRLFKLIGGGSFTEADKIAELARAYALGGADCIDIAPDLAVIQAVDEALSARSGPRPVLMISLPLDPDPHFRKIELAEPDCIRCGLCLPECPTEAITLPNALEISQALCYGCGRCVPVCPTDALSLLPFQVESHIEAALSHPAVQALEIHSRYADPYMLEAFLNRWQPLLEDKLIALCFRPTEIPAEQLLDFCHVAQEKSLHPILLQIDGAPMSGTEDPEASRPALEAAVHMAELLQNQSDAPPITISGGINPHTAHWLQADRYRFIAGVGMGTMARKAIWNLPQAQATRTATEIVNLFKTRV